MYYDPMISKLCTWAPTRLAAVDGMGRALEDFHIEGLGQNIPFLAAVMDQERFRSGQLSTNYIKDEFPDGFGGTEPTARPDRHPDRRRRGHAAGLRRPGAQPRRGPVGKPRDRVGGGRRPAKRRVKVGGRGDFVGRTARRGPHPDLTDIDWRPGKPTFRARSTARPSRSRSPRPPRASPSATAPPRPGCWS
jgi:propionyl-CoA carboxylase alpha chain